MHTPAEGEPGKTAGPSYEYVDPMGGVSEAGVGVPDLEYPGIVEHGQNLAVFANRKNAVAKFPDLGDNRRRQFTQEADIHRWYSRRPETASSLAAI